MPKKMTPKSQAKIIINYFLALKKYHANKYKISSFICIMRIYSNVYDCVYHMYVYNVYI